ncbi:MAG: hypothetical protein JJU34_00750 [Lunatimonas sp.]|uniref:hypothetical protein n=1 Tax=Lunatimonas sp. TaxID=2060141 RepID=UPI00263A76D9|nr:hypothetical protein [Lunatimonas sp.]MCC5935783.1 hypothetical protein [Lunatimonas sp.]
MRSARHLRVLAEEGGHHEHSRGQNGGGTISFLNSHLVIGIHGSGMILPSSLAAAFINIVPRYKIVHIAEETALVHVPHKLQQYLGRYVDEHASPELLASHAVSMWQGTPLKWQASFAQYD